MANSWNISLHIQSNILLFRGGKMKGTGKKVLFISAVAAITVGITYSTVMAVRSNNEALNKVAEGSQITETTDFTDGLNDGEYEGTADGYGGPITVRITIKDGKLTDIVIVSHSETPEYFDKANAVINEILKSGSVNVDAVSGATITSNAIKKAVAEALLKAGFKQQANEQQANVLSVEKDNKTTNNVKGNVQSSFIISNANINDGVFMGTGQGFNGPCNYIWWQYYKYRYFIT